MSERTLSIIKPDGVSQKVVGRVLARLEAEGFRIVALKTIHMSKAQAEGFYAVHRERPFFGSLTDFMSEGPCMPMVLERDNAIARLREVMGATDPAKADEGTLRKELATNVERNIIHVDFIHVDTEKAIRRLVPLEYVGKPEGVKAGGVLQITRREIQVEALPTRIPEKAVIIVEPLLIGQSIHVEEVELPEGVQAIYERNFTLCAVVAPTEEKAAEAEVQRGEYRGPLHGIPLGMKDAYDTKGIRTTYGCQAYDRHVPAEDSTTVERLRRAGAIMLGKTNTPEFGLLGMTENRLGDSCRNPWNRERTTGGSSGGAGAAVAAGLCSLATGSDGGGSIRIPSSFCGIALMMKSPRCPVLQGGTWPAISYGGMPGLHDAAAMHDR